jgi:hypothetical protein
MKQKKEGRNRKKKTKGRNRKKGKFKGTVQRDGSGRN